MNARFFQAEDTPQARACQGSSHFDFRICSSYSTSSGSSSCCRSNGSLKSSSLSSISKP
jgi:hypothetical protein